MSPLNTMSEDDTATRDDILATAVRIMAIVFNVTFNNISVIL
jgi:hypothetical protein